MSRRGVFCFSFQFCLLSPFKFVFVLQRFMVFERAMLFIRFVATYRATVCEGGATNSLAAHAGFLRFCTYVVVSSFIWPFGRIDAFWRVVHRDNPPVSLIKGTYVWFRFPRTSKLVPVACLIDPRPRDTSSREMNAPPPIPHLPW